MRSKTGAKNNNNKKKGLLELRLIDLTVAGDKEDLPRGLSLEQAQVMGLQRSHAEIRDEMTGIRERLNTLMQRMQRNNLQPQPRQALRVPRNDIIEADEDPNGDDEADDRVSNLRFHRLEGVVHLRNTWSGFRRLKRCLNGMNILKKGSARWQHLSLQIMLFYGGKT